MRGKISNAFRYLIISISSSLKLPFSWIPDTPGCAWESGTYGSFDISQSVILEDFSKKQLTVNPSNETFCSNEAFQSSELDSRRCTGEIEVISSKLRKAL